MHQPWLMTPMDEMIHEFALDKDYPRVIIDLQKDLKTNKDALWAMRKNDVVRAENGRIIATHTRAQPAKKKREKK
jgi:deoxyribodipyrimidine photo-lyase